MSTRPTPQRVVLEADSDWMDKAICRGLDPEIFFPAHPNEGSEAGAVAWCGTCPVQAECLTWALESGQTAGVWGGYGERARRKMARSGIRIALRCPVCGSTFPSGECQRCAARESANPGIKRGTMVERWVEVSGPDKTVAAAALAMGVSTKTLYGALDKARKDGDKRIPDQYVTEHGTGHRAFKDQLNRVGG